MKIGIVCPYSFDVPGGVQFHIRDLAEELIARGHQVSVFAPASQPVDLPFFVSAGKAIAVPYNGSVARLRFGPIANAKAKAWIQHRDFDVLHAHEPITPSVSLLAVSAAKCPVVGTFHTATERSVMYSFCLPFLLTIAEKIGARIAVSEEARRTLVEHQGGDAVVIPNGVYVDHFAKAKVPDSLPIDSGGPVFSFLGRLDEPRKGLAVLTRAIPSVLQQYPQAQFLIAGGGQAKAERAALAAYGKQVKFLGFLSDQDKAGLLRASTAYIAPQTGGESFGIVLVEAMAAKTLVVASSIPAFHAVLAGGKNGCLFENGNSQALAQVLLDICAAHQGNARASYFQDLTITGHRAAWRCDWSVVTDQIVDVYRAAIGAGKGGV